MIISVTLENWMSFRDRYRFIMIASKERQHGDRVPKLGKYQTRVLPISVIYGGNASGKSNFFKALRFVQKLVVQGTQPEQKIRVDPFRLEKGWETRPTRFSFELLVDETLYEFSFAVTAQEVLEEKLVVINPTSEKTLYHRIEGKPHFADHLAADPFLHFAFNGTRENQLFLTNAVSQKVDTFRPIYNWFKDRLCVISANEVRPLSPLYYDPKHSGHPHLTELLQRLDTGISHFGTQQNNPWDTKPFAHFFKHNQKFITNLDTTADPQPSYRPVAYHLDADGEPISFELAQESDGTRHLLELLPAFAALTAPNADKVYVIDELDRSLHSQLTWSLLQAYLATGSAQSRAQLLLTTHDLHLMDQQLFRRDEMWVAERDAQGASHLISFGDFRDVRYDKDIRKSYLQGRLGGIPRLDELVLREAG